jgi:hypothetical protein
MPVHRIGASSQQAYAALWQAEFGNLVQARKDAASALALSPGRDGKLVVAMALARVGDVSRAKAVADEVLKAYPLDTLLQFYSLPSIRAAAELSRGDAAKAEDFTEHARPYELGSPTDLRPLYPIYVRGQAYLAMHRGNDAAVEFQKILDHRGLNVNSPPRRFSSPANRPGLRNVWRPGQGPHCLPGFPHTVERRRSRHSYPEARQS